MNSYLLEALGKIGGPKAGKELVALLKEEFAFWQKRGPRLKGDWWNDWEQWDQGYLQARHSKFTAIIGALGEAKYPECCPLIREVQFFLKNHPHLDGGGGYASRWCRVILEQE